jgi:hypothetical protein
MRAFSVKEKAVIKNFKGSQKEISMKHGLGAKLNKSENEKRTRKSIQLKRFNAKIARTPKCGKFKRVWQNCSIRSAGCSENL